MGKNCSAPTCKLCGDAHWSEPGKVCPKYRRHAQPKRLALPAPKKGKAK